MKLTYRASPTVGDAVKELAGFLCAPEFVSAVHRARALKALSRVHREMEQSLAKEMGIPESAAEQLFRALDLAIPKPDATRQKQ